MHTGEDVREAGRWFFRRGFGTAVGVAAVVGLVTAVTVDLPSELPSVALQAAPVYRLEVGAALFTGLYLISMAFFLALQNRGFTELGPGGVKAQDLGRVPDLIDTQEDSLAVLAAITDEVRELRDKRTPG